jgi:hypothetical protein
VNIDISIVPVIEGWNLVVSKVGIVYGEFKKQYDGNAY